MSYYNCNIKSPNISNFRLKTYGEFKIPKKGDPCEPPPEL